MRQPGRKKSLARLAKSASAGKTMPTAPQMAETNCSSPQEPGNEGENSQGQQPKLSPAETAKLSLPENLPLQGMDIPILSDKEEDVPVTQDVAWGQHFVAIPAAEEIEALKFKLTSLGAQMAKRIGVMETALNQSLGDIPQKCANPLKTKLEEIKRMISKLTEEAGVLRKHDAQKQEVIKDLKIQVEGYKAMVNLQTEKINSMSKKINSMSKSNEKQEANIHMLANSTKSSVELQKQALLLLNSLANQQAGQSQQNSQDGQNGQGPAY